MNKEKKNKETIIIFGQKKTGSSLIRQLLDGHPELFVYPTEFNSNYVFTKINTLSNVNFIGNYLLNTNDYLKSKTSKRNNYTRNFDNFHQIENEFLSCENTNKLKKIDFNIYRKSLLKQSKNIKSKYSILEIERKAIQESLSNKYIFGDKICFKEVGDDVSHLKSLLTKNIINKVIFIKRNPEDILSSRIKFDAKTKNMKTNFVRKWSTMLVYYNLNKQYNSFLEEFSNQTLIINYEQLVLNTNSTLNDIAKFLNIRHNNILHKTTMFGEISSVTTASRNGNGTVFSSSINSDLSFFDKILCQSTYNRKNIINKILNLTFKIYSKFIYA